MRLVLTRRASRDIADIYDYNARRSVRSAKAIERRIRDACQRAADFPGASPRTSKPNVHRAPMTQHPFTLYYRIKADLGLVEILRVIYSPRIVDLDTPPD